MLLVPCLTIAERFLTPTGTGAGNTDCDRERGTGQWMPIFWLLFPRFPRLFDCMNGWVLRVLARDLHRKPLQGKAGRLCFPLIAVIPVMNTWNVLPATPTPFFLSFTQRFYTQQFCQSGMPQAQDLQSATGVLCQLLFNSFCVDAGLTVPTFKSSDKARQLHRKAKARERTGQRSY